MAVFFVKNCPFKQKGAVWLKCKVTNHRFWCLLAIDLVYLVLNWFVTKKSNTANLWKAPFWLTEITQCKPIRIIAICIIWSEWGLSQAETEMLTKALLNIQQHGAIINCIVQHSNAVWSFLLLNLATKPFYCFPTSVHFNRRLLEGCVRTPTQKRRSPGELG